MDKRQFRWGLNTHYSFALGFNPRLQIGNSYGVSKFVLSIEFVVSFPLFSKVIARSIIVGLIKMKGIKQ